MVGGLFINSYGFLKEFQDVRITESNLNTLLDISLKKLLEVLGGRKHDRVQLFWYLKVKNKGVKGFEFTTIEASGNVNTVRDFFIGDFNKAVSKYSSTQWLQKSWAYYVTTTKTRRVSKADTKKFGQNKKPKVSNSKNVKKKKSKVRNVRRRGK